MSKLPWLKFFPRDYLHDTRPLSLSARGLWMDVLCFMAERDLSRLAYPVSEWCRMLRCGAAEFEAAITELLQWNIAVIHRAETETYPQGGPVVSMFCRRFARDKRRRKQMRDAQRRTRGSNVENDQDNHRDSDMSTHGQHTVNTQSSGEARGQRPETQKKKEKESYSYAPANASSDRPPPPPSGRQDPIGRQYWRLQYGDPKNWGY